VKIYFEELDEAFCIDIYLTWDDIARLREGRMLSIDEDLHDCTFSIGLIPSGEGNHYEREEEEEG
jgi:hypothetical protein